MTEEKAAAAPRKRKTAEELRVMLQAKLKALDESQDIRLKRRLTDLQAQAQALVNTKAPRNLDKLVAQAASLLGQAAAELKVQVPQ